MEGDTTETKVHAMVWIDLRAFENLLRALERAGEIQRVDDRVVWKGLAS
jgi:hypothetical protein